LITVTAGFFRLETDDTVLAVEERCKAYGTSPPADGTAITVDEQQYVLKEPEWKESERIFLATMWRVRERALPSKLGEQGNASAVDSRLGEAASFAYRPSLGLSLIQSNPHGPRHNRAMRLLQAAKIISEGRISPDIVPDALKRMQNAALLKRVEFSLTGIDALREAELRKAGLSGALDDLKKYGGTSLHITISLGHTPGQLDSQARGLLEKLSEIRTGVRTVKVIV